LRGGSLAREDEMTEWEKKWEKRAGGKSSRVSRGKRRMRIAENNTIMRKRRCNM